MYIIDSDVLIDAKNRHYGFDFVPAFWEWIARQHQAGRVLQYRRWPMRCWRAPTS